MDYHVDEKTLPVGMKFIPPHSYTATEPYPEIVPAWFQQTRYGGVPEPRRADMDPPLHKELAAQQTGRPNITPDFFKHHAGVQTTKLHRERQQAVPENVGRPPAYHPQVHEMAQEHPLGAMPVGWNLEHSGRVPQSVKNIHQLMMMNMAGHRHRETARDRFKDYKKEVRSKDGKGKDRGKGRGHPDNDPGSPASDRDSTPSRFEGNNTACSICLENFKNGDPLTRAACNHLFHEHCYHPYYAQRRSRGETVDCPACKGPGHIKAHFRYVGFEDYSMPPPNRRSADTPRDEAEHANARPRRSRAETPRRPSNSSSNRTSLLEAANGGFTHRGYTPVASPSSSDREMLELGPRIFMLNVDEPEETPTMSPRTLSYYNAWCNDYDAPETFEQYCQNKALQEESEIPLNQEATLINARDYQVKGPGMLVDLGSKINIAGENTLRRYEDNHLRPHNLKVNYQAKSQPLAVTGVGKGATICRHTATVPVAPTYRGKPTQKDVYRCEVASGCGADLPMIYGNESMLDKNSVIILRKNGPSVMAFPGPEGFEVNWSQGTSLLTMDRTTSGHLQLTCDNFEDLNDAAAMPSTTSFVTHFRDD